MVASLNYEDAFNDEIGAWSSLTLATHLHGKAYKAMLSQHTWLKVFEEWEINLEFSRDIFHKDPLEMTNILLDYLKAKAITWLSISVWFKLRHEWAA